MDLYFENQENEGINDRNKLEYNNIKINVGNNERYGDPPKKQNTYNEQKYKIKEDSPKKFKKKKKKKPKSGGKENGISCSSISIINIKKSRTRINRIKKNLFSNFESIEEKKKEKKKEGKIDEDNKTEEVKKPENTNIKYIDEELNRMDYKTALINDKRNYWQYYWSFLKKKHMIILTFVSNDDYNVFLLKFSLFILSLALFFSINTFFLEIQLCIKFLHNVENIV